MNAPIVLISIRSVWGKPTLHLSKLLSYVLTFSFLVWLCRDESVQSVVKIYKDPDLDEKVGSFSEKRTFMMARSKNYHYDYLDEYNLCADLSLGLSSSMTGLRSITPVFQIFKIFPLTKKTRSQSSGGQGSSWEPLALLAQSNSVSMEMILGTMTTMTIHNSYHDKNKIEFRLCLKA